VILRSLARLARDRGGVTLVEVMIAVGVLTIGLAALVAAVPFATSTMRDGARLSTATFLANERLEQVRLARWTATPKPVDELGVSPTAIAAPVSGGAITFPDESALPAPYGEYARTVRVSDCASGGCSGVARTDLRQVTVAVTYRPTTGTGVAPADTVRTATVTTFVSKR
jgi:uncharacterized protein (TIGR02598 family)